METKFVVEGLSHDVGQSQISDGQENRKEEGVVGISNDVGLKNGVTIGLENGATNC